MIMFAPSNPRRLLSDAGPIGSHIVNQPPQGCNLVTLDTLSAGCRNAMPGSALFRLVVNRTEACRGPVRILARHYFHDIL
jgi:hypothetical protein